MKRTVLLAVLAVGCDGASLNRSRAAALLEQQYPRPIEWRFLIPAARSNFYDLNATQYVDANAYVRYFDEVLALLKEAKLVTYERNSFVGPQELAGWVGRQPYQLVKWTTELLENRPISVVEQRQVQAYPSVNGYGHVVAVKMAEWQFDEVTGIRFEENGQAAVVEYSIKISESMPGVEPLRRALVWTDPQARGGWNESISWRNVASLDSIALSAGTTRQETAYLRLYDDGWRIEEKPSLFSVPR